jgi:HD-GYP domain-containing protein (c-di-GMP phosphodiesterase class II)
LLEDKDAEIYYGYVWYAAAWGFSMIELNYTVKDDQTYEEVYQNYLNVIGELHAIFIKIILNQFVVPDCMDGFVNKIYHNHKQFLEFIIGTKTKNQFQAKQAVDTAVISTALAENMGQSIYSISKIIEAALLHDVGMFYVPKDVINKPEALGSPDLHYIFSHPLQSSQFITKELRCFDDVAAIAMQHHEAWNGTGYPRRLSGKETFLEARIIAAADAFAAMISERAYRNPLSGHEAVQHLLAGINTKFDPAVIKHFVQVVGVYPVGSLVELTNGDTARVVEYISDASGLKPRVRLVDSAQEDLIKDRAPIDLLDKKGIFVKKDSEADQEILIDLIQKF